MGRRLNTTQPTVIQTMLTPLSDAFDIEADDTLEQWYYVNTGAYSPDRTQTPLRLTPTLSATDTGTGDLYRPSFASVLWYYFNPSDTTDYSSGDPYWPGTGWVRVTAIEATTAGVPNDYYCPTSSTNPTLSLFVRKNVAPPTTGGTAAGQNICCVATYTDPRDNGVTTEVRATVLLATNKDATSKLLRINLLAPTKTLFNVLSSATSLYQFQAQVLDENNTDITSDYYIEWRGKENNGVTEVSVSTLPCYTQAPQPAGKGQGTDTIVLDAMFTENLMIVCRLRPSAVSAQVLPPVAHCSLVWEFPRIEAQTVCRNGRAVNERRRDMTFTNIINHRGGVVGDAQRRTNFLFNFKRRVSTSSNFTDMGWGDEVTVGSDVLRNVSSYSVPVLADVYLLGAYKEVTDDNEVVTDDNEAVFDRL